MFIIIDCLTNVSKIFTKKTSTGKSDIFSYENDKHLRWLLITFVSIDSKHQHICIYMVHCPEKSSIIFTSHDQICMGDLQGTCPFCINNKRGGWRLAARTS